MRRLGRSAGLVLVAAALMTLGAARPAGAIVQQTGPNQFVAGVPTACFKFFAAPEMAGRQRQSNWCWAACVQMVLNCHGLRVSQEQVVERIFGARVNAPADFQQLLIALSGWAPSILGDYRRIVVNIRDLSDGRVVDDLAKNCPRIVGLRGSPVGHAYVLTAVHFHLEGRRPVIDRYVLRDPNPRAPSRVELGRGDFRRRVLCNVGVYVKLR